MDFFQYQADAKRRTKLLVFYYSLAVVAIVGTVYFGLALGLLFSEVEPPAQPDYSQLWHPELLFWTVLGVGGIILLGSLFKIFSLSGGGKSVARMMGGVPIAADTDSPAERRLLNIVEEMAIAAGVPVPPVYVIDEEGINAFAAGFKPSDAVIGVTRGCLARLNRDELQGVIAHEFSHIVNGDMRLNIRLIGVLFGILLITVVGQFLLRIGLYSGLAGGGGGGRSRGRGGRGGNGLPLALAALGILLMIVGAIGVFFGRLIKSAVSRQREFLADASAVQFTRNPDGIGGALKKIGGFSSRINSAHAEETSHMFFANGLKSSMSGLLATHPPLAERIRRIDPKFTASQDGHGSAAPASAAVMAGAAGLSGGADRSGDAASPERVTGQIGTLQADNLYYAVSLIKEIPQSLRTLVRSPSGARAVVYGLLFSGERQARAVQHAWLREHLDQDEFRYLQEARKEVDRLPSICRMPLIDLSMTALQQMNTSEYHQFRQGVEQLVAADNKVGIFEFALSRSLLRNLEPVFGRPERPAVAYHGLRFLLPHCLPLLAVLAGFGNEQDDEQAALDFKAGVAQLGLDPESTSRPESHDDPVAIFARALPVLRQADDKLKKRIVRSCVAAVVGNQQITVEEAELLRAVSDSLDCPLPPLLFKDTGR